MKTLMLIALLISGSAFAQTITLSDRDPNEERAEIPALLVSTLIGSGLKFRALNDGIYAITAKNVHCESRHNGPLGAENPMAGVPTQICRVNSEEVRDSTRGRRLGEASALWELLVRMEIGDCSLGGYCAAFMKSVNCTVDTNVEALKASGRFACTLEY